MIRHIRMDERDTASMKALPKRKGNGASDYGCGLSRAWPQ